MQMKKIGAMVSTVIFAAAALAGCSGVAADAPAEGGTGALDKSGEALRLSTDPVLSFSSADNNFGISKDAELQAAVVKLLEEKAGVKLEPIIPPLANYITKVETMVASGELPDVMVVHQAITRVPNYVYRGKLLKLDDYIRNSEKLSSIPADNYDILRINGSIYHVPFEKQQVKIIYMRKDIMEEYDIQLSNTPTTEEFFTEMKKLKGTGIIPFSFPKWIDNYQFFMNSFGAYAGIYKNEEGVYVDGFQEPQMKAALEYICQLYQEGIMDPAFYTTEIPTTQEMVSRKKAACVIDFVGNYTYYLTQSEAAGVYSDVYPIYALVGPEGKSGGLNIAIRTALTVSAECRNPDKAIALIEALVCDAETYAAFKCLGVEGEHYTLDAQNMVVATEKAKNSGYAPLYTYLYEAFPQDFSNIKVVPPEPIADSLEMQREIMNLAQEHKGPKYVVPSGLSDAYDQAAPSIVDAWQDITAQIVLGDIGIEQGMEDYRSFWNSIGGEQILKELNGQ